MANRIPFGTNEIVILESAETIQNQCSGGDIAIKEASDGFYVYSIGDDMEVDSWEGAFETVEEAIQAIRANV